MLSIIFRLLTSLRFSWQICKYEDQWLLETWLHSDICSRNHSKYGVMEEDIFQAVYYKARLRDHRLVSIDR